MNILTFADGFGLLSDEQAHDLSENQHKVFPCGHCSNEDAKVFHNLLGVHNHIPASELIPKIPKEALEDA